MKQFVEAQPKRWFKFTKRCGDRHYHRAIMISTRWRRMLLARQSILYLAILIMPRSISAEDFPLERNTAKNQLFERQNQEMRCQLLNDGGYRWPCSDDYRVELGRRSVHDATFLDLLILMVDDFRRLTFNTGLGRDTKLDFGVRSFDVSRLGGNFKLTLRIKF